ncbi:DUF4239 domain-containing protein [uncultured Rhodoblastus sp.]|uniref:bestrophin-like domain n=1 Tax=uncultured Rhodoblastus sp. TaxID=543037 RepID=UPI0025E207B7|nr:DUF4239 domain-containing protein [uncultured Rhodoblastus sp.]
MFYWIYDYPAWTIGLLFASVFVAVAWTGTFLARKSVHEWFHSEPRANEMVGFALSSFFVLYGLLLGLLSVAAYQNYATVSDLVDKEASSLAALYRDLSSYPEPIRDRLTDQLREYARYTIEDGWPQQRAGIVPRGGTQRIGALAKILFAFEPVTKGEEIKHAEALRQFNHLVELRRSRLANVTTGLPAVLWWVLALGSLLSIMLIWLLEMEIHVHLILGGALAGFLGIVIFLIAELDNPFRGEVSVGPDSIALVYESLMMPEALPPPEAGPQRNAK